MMKEADIEDILISVGPFTLFAPSDDSFSFLPGSVWESFRKDNEKKREFIMHHVVPGTVSSASVKNDGLIEAARGPPVRCNLYGGGNIWTVSGAQVSQPDLRHGEYTVHIIDHFLYPPATMNNLDYIRANFENFNRMFTIADPNNYVTEGTFTIFVPVDEAFNALPDFLQESIFTNNSVLQSVLLNHLVPSTYYRIGLPEGNTLTSLDGNTLRFKKRRGMIMVNGIPIVAPDISVTNGVIHVVNRVILPPNIFEECNCVPTSTTVTVKPTTTRTRTRPFRKTTTPVSKIETTTPPGRIKRTRSPPKTSTRRKFRTTPSTMLTTPETTEIPSTTASYLRRKKPSFAPLALPSFESSRLKSTTESPNTEPTVTTSCEDAYGCEQQPCAGDDCSDNVQTKLPEPNDEQQTRPNSTPNDSLPFETTSEEQKKDVDYRDDSPASEPNVNEPLVSEPSTSDPTASDPNVSEPTVSEPSASDPTASDPNVSEPTASDPNVSYPSASEPSASDLPVSETNTNDLPTSKDASNTYPQDGDACKNGEKCNTITVQPIDEPQTDSECPGGNSCPPEPERSNPQCTEGGNCSDQMADTPNNECPGGNSCPPEPTQSKPECAEGADCTPEIQGDAYYKPLGCAYEGCPEAPEDKPNEPEPVSDNNCPPGQFCPKFPQSAVTDCTDSKQCTEKKALKKDKPTESLCPVGNFCPELDSTQNIDCPNGNDCPPVPDCSSSSCADEKLLQCPPGEPCPEAQFPDEKPLQNDLPNNNKLDCEGVTCSPKTKPSYDPTQRRKPTRKPPGFIRIPYGPLAPKPKPSPSGTTTDSSNDMSTTPDFSVIYQATTKAPKGPESRPQFAPDVPEEQPSNTVTATASAQTTTESTDASTTLKSSSEPSESIAVTFSTEATERASESTSDSEDPTSSPNTISEDSTTASSTTESVTTTSSATSESTTVQATEPTTQQPNSSPHTSSTTAEPTKDSTTKPTDNTNETVPSTSTPEVENQTTPKASTQPTIPSTTFETKGPFDFVDNDSTIVTTVVPDQTESSSQLSSTDSTKDPLTTAETTRDQTQSSTILPSSTSVTTEPSSEPTTISSNSDSSQSTTENESSTNKMTATTESNTQTQSTVKTTSSSDMTTKGSDQTETSKEPQTDELQNDPTVPEQTSSPSTQSLDEKTDTRKTDRTTPQKTTVPTSPESSPMNEDPTKTTADKSTTLEEPTTSCGDKRKKPQKPTTDQPDSTGTELNIRSESTLQVTTSDTKQSESTTVAQDTTEASVTQASTSPTPETTSISSQSTSTLVIDTSASSEPVITSDATEENTQQPSSSASSEAAIITSDATEENTQLPSSFGTSSQEPETTSEVTEDNQPSVSVAQTPEPTSLQTGPSSQTTNQETSQPTETQKTTSDIRTSSASITISEPNPDETETPCVGDNQPCIARRKPIRTTTPQLDQYPQNDQGMPESETTSTAQTLDTTKTVKDQPQQTTTKSERPVPTIVVIPYVTTPPSTENPEPTSPEPTQKDITATKPTTPITSYVTTARSSPQPDTFTWPPSIEDNTLYTDNMPTTISPQPEYQHPIPEVEDIVPEFPEPPNSIEDVLNRPNLVIGKTPVTFRIILRLFSNVGLTDILLRKGPYTLCVPTDAAFALLPAGYLESMQRNGDLLRKILLHHVITTQIPVSSLRNNHIIRTYHGQPVIINVLNAGKLVLIGGTRVLGTTRTRNGVIYAVDRVLSDLPQYNLLRALRNNPELGHFYDYVMNSPLKQVLRARGPFTLVAPTNDAINRLSPDILNLLATNQTALEKVLYNHLAAGAYYSNGIQNGLTLPTPRGGTLRFTITSNGLHANDALILHPDISTGNGVLHVADEVLLSSPDIFEKLSQDYNPSFPQPTSSYPILSELSAGLGVDTFIKWFESSGLLETISDGGRYTILAPTDIAVQALPPTTLKSLQENPSMLQQVLRFHVIRGFLQPNVISSEDTIPTLLQGKDVRFNWYRNETELTVSGARLGLERRRGHVVIQVINKVLYPPTGDVMNTISKSPLLRDLTRAVRMSGLEKELSDPSKPCTLFAPTQEAFKNLPESDYNRLFSDPQEMRSLLMRHMSSGTLFSVGVTNGMIIPSRNGVAITMTTKPQCMAVDGVNVLYSDITATNGVVHVLNHLL